MISLSAVVDIFCVQLVDSCQPCAVTIIICRLLQFSLKQVVVAARNGPMPPHKYRALLQRMLAAHVSRIRSLADCVPTLLRLVRRLPVPRFSLSCNV